jgi:hypothetical protein
LVEVLEVVVDMTVEGIMEEEEVEVEVETAEVNEVEEAEGEADIEVRNSTWMLLLSLTTHRVVTRDR